MGARDRLDVFRARSPVLHGRTLCHSRRAGPKVSRVVIPILHLILKKPNELRYRFHA